MNDTTSESSTFSGWQRKKATKWSVKVGDSLSRWIISIGGIGTIVAVLTVFFFLVYVVAPLFTGASISDQKTLEAEWMMTRPLRTGMDEYKTIGYMLQPDGVLRVIRLDTGEVIDERQVIQGKRITASSFSIMDDQFALGYADGSMQFGELRVVTSFVNHEDMPPEFHVMQEGDTARHERGIVQVTPTGQFREKRVEVSFQDPIAVSPGSPIILLDQISTSTGPMIAALTENGTLKLAELKERRNLLTQKVTVAMTEAVIPYEPHPEQGHPTYLLLSGLGDNLYLAWTDGSVIRYNTRDKHSARIEEEFDLVESPSARLTTLGYIIGRTTMIAGDSTGTLQAWFPTRLEGQSSYTTVAAHRFAGEGEAVTAFTPSKRTRLIAAGYADGSIHMVYVTSEKNLASIDSGFGTAVTSIAFSPREDGLLALSQSEMARFDVTPGYPEASATSLFTPVWYEGYSGPSYTWQSSAGTDDFEPKLSLVPLIFGTLKATFYAMLFGVPIAILAAIYTSEFLNPKVRARIKPVVELMASLPSVVLGFIAALVIAPIAQKMIPGILASFVTIPLAFLIGAYLWQLLPHQLTLRLAHARIFAILGIFPLGVLLAALLGPVMEKLFYGGDIKRWLSDHHFGNGTGAWMILACPLSAALVAFLFNGVVNPYIRSISHDWGRRKTAVVDAVKFASGLAVAVILAVAVSSLLTAVGLDPRGSYVDKYDPRNALIVGFVMGFAIIPIIYTISEDALSTVPEHLRSASLGCGATPWQTATRVIIPTAMSGLFSACMIGLGRAVGETMIVLMAAGNTPILDMNIFNGFRTLSANIAVEMPEAVRNSTHYRTLFLAALALFVMTFAVNTVAEFIRIRFRRRAFQL